MRVASIFAIFVCVVAFASAHVYFKETFDGNWQDRWVESDWKEAGTRGKFAVTAGKFYNDAEEDKGLQTTEDYRFYTISADHEEFSNKGKTLVLQYSLKNQQKLDCGGGYLKFFPAGVDKKTLNGDSQYNIMFGPDICGTTTRRVHVIFEHDGKNHLVKKDIPCETDELSHLYTLIVRPDNTFEVLVDGASKATGSLETDFEMLPPKEIPDPAAKKPADWVDEKEIDDPEDKKPEGYENIPAEIVDPEAKKPEDWDDELDGEWEAPMIPNPDFKGEWKARRIPNPAYKGEWVHPQIPNPDYKPNAELYAYDSFKTVGIEIWQVKAGSIFDNIIITDSEEEAREFGKLTLEKTKKGEKEMFEKQQEEEKKKREEERKAAEEAQKNSEDVEDAQDAEAEATEEAKDEL
jgi:calreticulin